MNLLKHLENNGKVAVAEDTLYINHSNGIAGSWRIILWKTPEGHGQLEMQTSKVIGGKASSKFDTISEGKNLGKANATTPMEQAQKEFVSRINKKLLKGYTKEVPVAGTKSMNSMGLDKPMLAEKFQDFEIKQWPVAVQPKFDGNRCLARRVDGEIVLWSRGGKPISVPHIAKQLESILVDETVTLDGELYIHGMTLQAITSLVKRNRDESLALDYQVYDIVSPEPYAERLKVLTQLLKDKVEAPKVRLTHTMTANSFEELDKLHRHFVWQGFEGTMVRDLSVGYETGKRSQSLLKMKDFQDDEFEIIDVVKGKPNHFTSPTGVALELQVAIYVCRTKEGKVFSVTAEGTNAEKNEAWLQRIHAVGRMLKVKYFNWTPDGAPFIPTSLGLWEPL